MNFLKLKLMNLNYYRLNIAIIFSSIFFISNVYSSEIEINGNKYSDDEVILSIIGDIPNSDIETQSNYILKKLNKSDLFDEVEIFFKNDKFTINVIEYPSIANIFYNNNERLKDEELDQIITELEINILSDSKISILIDELKKIYQSFGYNNIKIETKSDIFDNNSADLYIDFIEGKITKIKNIFVSGNNNFSNEIILSKINSKTKKITNIFANNNFKYFQLNNDLIRIRRFYKSQGYRDIDAKYNVEYYPNNKVDITFNINEGNKYYFSNIEIENLISNDKVKKNLTNFISNNSLENIEYNPNKLDNLELEIANILEDLGEQFFEIRTLEKINNSKVDVKFRVQPTKPIYIKQINISGNTRTYDHVIRREIDVYEGDTLNDTKLKKINKNIKALSFFSKVEVNKKPVDNNYENIEIIVEETQTGSFNVGLSLGTLDGVTFVTGLNEKNINGSGRSVDFLINTNDNNKAFTLSTAEKFALNNKVNHQYSLKYKENDFSKSKSYKLNTLSLDTNFSYLLAENLNHKIGIGYSLKDYNITNSSSVATNVLNSSGENISFNFLNEFYINTLNSYIKPTRGHYIIAQTLFETPSSSTNGFVKNTVTLRKYLENNTNIYSAQAKVGNIFSLSDNEILSDDKFSLGGRWLRGFDNFGAGPRDSRTAYVGGNNLVVTKLDFSKPLTLNNQNPIYLNIFNDYGLVWGNKNNVISSDQSIRSSYGFGLNYYSPIGPIGFSWGFPLLSKEYDIERMFMFTIGNLN